MNATLEKRQAKKVISFPVSDLDTFECHVRQRRSSRHFLPSPVEDELVERLLRIAQWSPSSFNLQPTRFLVITDPAIRPALRHACMDQGQVEEAPVVVVFLGDRNAFRQRYDEIVNQDIEAGAITPEYGAMLRRNGRLMFDKGPAWLGWLWKAALIPIVRWFRPVPEVPVVHERFWLAKQVMLTAGTFLLAAQHAGLNTIPLEGFDTGRLRRLLRLPASLEPILVVPLGRAVPARNQKTRLPIESVTDWL